MRIAYFTNDINRKLKDTIIISVNNIADDCFLLPSNLIMNLLSYKLINNKIEELIEDIKELDIDLIVSDSKDGLGVFANICSIYLDLPLIRIVDDIYTDYLDFVDNNEKLFCNNCVRVIHPNDNLNNYVDKSILNYKYALTIEKINIKNDYVVLYMDNNEKLYLSFDTYNNGLFKTKYKISELNYRYLKEKESEFLAYRSAIKKLSIRDYSIKEIRDSIHNKYKLETKKIDNIIDKLVNYNLLDDVRYTINKIEYYKNNHLSNKAIKLKLKKVGINDEIIEKNLFLDDKQEYENALCKAIKYQSIIKNKSLYAAKQSIYSKLINEGFSYNIVKDVVDKLKFESISNNQLDILKKEMDKTIYKNKKKYKGKELKKDREKN